MLPVSALRSSSASSEALPDTELIVIQPTQLLYRHFERFITNKYERTGLGLVISKQLARLMNDHIQIES